MFSSEKSEISMKNYMCGRNFMSIALYFLCRNDSTFLLNNVNFTIYDVVMVEDLKNKKC